MSSNGRPTLLLVTHQRERGLVLVLMWNNRRDQLQQVSFLAQPRQLGPLARVANTAIIPLQTYHLRFKRIGSGLNISFLLC